MSLRRLGFEVESGLGEEPVDEGGPVLMRLSRFLTTAASWPALRAARLPGPFFMFARAPSTGLRSESQGSRTTVSQSRCAAVIRPA